MPIPTDGEVIGTGYNATHRRHRLIGREPERYPWVPAFAGMMVVGVLLRAPIPTDQDGRVAAGRSGPKSISARFP